MKQATLQKLDFETLKYLSLKVKSYILKALHVNVMQIIVGKKQRAMHYQCHINILEMTTQLESCKKYLTLVYIPAL